MQLEFEINHTPALLMRVFWHRVMKGWLLMVIACAVLVASFLLKKGPDATAASGITLVGVFIAVYVVAFVQQRRQVAAFFRQQGDEPLHVTLTEESFRGASRLGVTELKWKAFKELRIHRDYWLLCFPSRGHITLPSKNVPADAAEFIRNKFQELGLPVRKV